MRQFRQLHDDFMTLLPSTATAWLYTFCVIYFYSFVMFDSMFFSWSRRDVLLKNVFSSFFWKISWCYSLEEVKVSIHTPWWKDLSNSARFYSTRWATRLNFRFFVCLLYLFAFLHLVRWNFLLLALVFVLHLSVILNLINSFTFFGEVSLAVL